MLRLLLSVLAALALAVPAQAHPAAARSAWGFDRSDLAPHPDVRFGVLANGLRYAIMRASAPAGSLSVRMRIDAAPTAEGPPEQGHVHLLEHLVFHGSNNLPENALLFMLPRDGLKRHSDFNAFTDYRQTVFRLDLARSDARARETALGLMDEIARDLSFDRRLVEGAKKMVREEIRNRDSVRDRLAIAQDAFLLPGTPMALGPVAGTGRSVARATPAGLKRLYDLYYRPERTTLVIAGEVDADVVEAEIAARFGGWRGRGPAAGPALPQPVRGDRAGEAHLFVDREVPTTVTLARVGPIGGSGDSAGSRGDSFLAGLAAEMLSRRMTRLAADPATPFSEAVAAVYDYFATAQVASVDAKAKAGDWRGTLAGAEAALRAALDRGFTQQELDVQLGLSGKRLDAAAAPRSAAALADAIVDAADRNIVFTVPQDPAAARAWLAGIRLDAVNRAFRAAWGDSPPLVFVSHDRPLAAFALSAGTATGHAR